MTTIVIGAGPAGIAASLRIKKLLPDYQVILVEAGNSLEERINQNDETIVCNGFAGAGLFSDRKLSIPPAGSELIDKYNLYEVKEAYRRTLLNMKIGLGSDQIDPLIEKMQMFLRNQSSEDFGREFSQLNKEILKTYPTVVLNEFTDAVKLMKYYQNQLNELGVEVKYNSIAKDISAWEADDPNNTDTKYVVTLASGEKIMAKRIVMAMGRFGSIQNICKGANFVTNKMEIGVRVKTENYPELAQVIHDLKEKDPLCQDPKFKITKTFIIRGKEVKCEFRTFCVCVPSGNADTNTEGYSVRSKDLVTGISTISGSSSYNELSLRNNKTHVYAGSNIGFMMRICDPDIITRTDLQGMFAYGDEVNNSIEFGNDMDSSVQNLSTVFPSELAYPLYDGIMSLVKYITKMDVLTEPITVLFPCIEGVGAYPTTTSEFEIPNMPDVYVGGDMIGHTRGLVQGFVGGDLIGNVIYIKHMEEVMRKNGNLKPYQSIVMPSYHYNKVAHGPIKSDQYKILMNWFQSANKYNDELIDTILIRAYEIQSEISHVKFTGTCDTMGVLYELHHFFLDKKIYTKTERLDYISTSSLADYISMCNAVNDSMDHIQNVLCTMMDRENNETWDTYRGEFVQGISRTINNFKFKSCVLSLRTRKSIDDRNNYTDIPIMQSAFHFNPVVQSVYKGKSFENVHLVETLITSFMCAILDTYIKEMIEKFSLQLILGRTKMETQEPAVQMVNSDESPLYLECHIKVNITGKDGSKIPYDKKKVIIQQLASLVEGSDAVEKGIFNAMAVSINLLKHPEFGQQFFLTYRSNTSESMAFVRKHFKNIMMTLCELDTTNELNKYKFVFIPDSEFVIYDNNRDLDLPWFPITENLLVKNYQMRIKEVTESVNHIFMVTHNSNKVNEITDLMRSLDVPICLHTYTNKFTPLLTSSIYELTKDKASRAYDLIQKPVIVESTGLYIDGYDQFPGALTGIFYRELGAKEICRLYGGKKVFAETVIISKNESETYYQNSITGTIPAEPAGENGFGWDNIFVPNGSTKTFAEMTMEEKNIISMRKKAYMDLFQIKPDIDVDTNADTDEGECPIELKSISSVGSENEDLEQDVEYTERQELFKTNTKHVKFNEHTEYV